MALGAVRLGSKFPSLQKDLSFKLFQKFSFDAFFVMRTAFGHFVNFWKDTNKPFGLSVVNTRVFFNVESSFVAFRRMFLFLTEAFESYRRFSIFFVSGLPVYDDFKSFFFFHKKTMPLLGHGFMIHWLGGLLTNLHCVLRNFFCNSEAALLKYKKQIKRDWFTSVQSGLRQLRQFPDIICFFSISGVYEVAAKEAKILKIPTISFVDSNCEVSDITFPIPGNDDSTSGLEFKILLFREFLLRTIKNRLFSEINSLLVQNSDLRHEVFNQHMEMLVSDLIVDRKFTFLQKNQTTALAGLNVFVNRRRKISVDLKSYFSSLSNLFFKKITKFKVSADSFFYRAKTLVCFKFYKNSFVSFLKKSIKRCFVKVKDRKKLGNKKRLFFCAIMKKNIRYKYKARSFFAALKLRNLFFVELNLFKFAYFFYFFVKFFFRKSLSFCFDRFFFILLLKDQLRSDVLFYFYKVIVLKNTVLRFFFKYRSYVLSDCFHGVFEKKNEFTLFNKCLVDFFGRCSSTIFRFVKTKIKSKYYKNKLPKLPIKRLELDKKLIAEFCPSPRIFIVPFVEKIPKMKPKRKLVVKTRPGVIGKITKNLCKQKKVRKVVVAEEGQKKLAFASMRNFLHVNQPVGILQLKALVSSKLTKLKRKISIRLARKLQGKFFWKFKFLRFGSGFRQYPHLSSFFFRRRRFNWFNRHRHWRHRHRYRYQRVVTGRNRFKFHNPRNFNTSHNRNKFGNSFRPTFKNRFVDNFKVQYFRQKLNSDINKKRKLKRQRRFKLKFKFVLKKDRSVLRTARRYRGYRRYKFRKFFLKLKPRYFFKRKFFKVFFVKKFLSKFFPIVKRKLRRRLQRSSLFNCLRRLGKKFLTLRRTFILFYRHRKRKLIFNKIKFIVSKYLLRLRFWNLIRNRYLLRRQDLSQPIAQRLDSLLTFKKLIFRLLFTGFIVRKLVLLSLCEVNFFFFYGFFMRKPFKVNFLFLFFTRLFYYFKFLYFIHGGVWSLLKMKIIPQFKLIFMLLGSVLTLNPLRLQRMFKIGMRPNFVNIFFRNLRACVFPRFVNKVFFRDYRFKRFHIFMKFRKHYLTFINFSQLSLIKLRNIFKRKVKFSSSRKGKKKYLKSLFKLGFLYYKYFSLLQLRARVFSKRKLFQKRYCLSLLLPSEKRLILPEKKSYLNFFLFMSKRRRARILFFFKFRKKYIKSLKLKRSLYQFNILRVF